MNPAEPKPADTPEDVHVHIGGVLALRFFSNGDIQVPTCPEKRRVIRRYLARIDAELKAYA